MSIVDVRLAKAVEEVEKLKALAALESAIREAWRIAGQEDTQMVWRVVVHDDLDA
jgi:hypothetical protein